MKIKQLSQFFTLLIFFTFSLNLFGQETFEVIDKSNIGIGNATESLITPDGFILVATRQDGLRAYTYDDDTFMPIAHINDGGEANGLALAGDGTIFLANGTDGLRAYTFDGTKFTNIAHIDSGGVGRKVALSADDATVFLANDFDGLRAFSFDGSSFAQTTHTETEAKTLGVAVGFSGTVFTANHTDGLHAFTYDGSSFTDAGNFDDDGVAENVTTLGDSVVFLANGQPGTYAFTYNGSSLTKKAETAWGWNSDVEISENGIVVISDIYGIAAYTLNGNVDNFYFTPLGSTSEVTSVKNAVALNDSIFVFASIGLHAVKHDRIEKSFTNLADINLAGGYSTSLKMGPNNTVYLGNSADGLRTYTLENGSLVNGVNLKLNSSIGDVGVQENGTVFFGAGTDGFWAYDLQNGIYDSTAHHLSYAGPWEVTIGPSGTIFNADGYQGLKAYTYDGTRFTDPIRIDNSGEYKGVDVDDNGTIFIANGFNIYAYTFDGTEFTVAGNKSVTGAQGIAVSPDSTIFVACGSFGVKAYKYDGSSFASAGSVRENLNSYAWDLTVGNDGTVFVAYHSLGLFAYSYDGQSFTRTAFVNNSTDATINTYVDVVIGDDGTVYAAQSGDGLFAYQYSGYDEGYNAAPTAADTTITPLLETYIFSTGDFRYADEDEMSQLSITRLPDAGRLEHFTADGGWAAVTQYQNITKTDLDLARLRIRYDNAEVDSTSFLFRVHDGTSYSRFSYEFTISFLELVSNESISDVIPRSFALYNNYPNPFNPKTTIGFDLAEAGSVTLYVYNVLGQKVMTLVDGFRPAGTYSQTLDASNLPSGIYFYQLKADGFSATKQLMLLK